MNRQTIKSAAKVEGVGIHTGEKCSMTFKPSKQGYISFLRTDIANAEPIRAAVENVSSTMRGTNLKNATAEVHTVEHVLSAANALGITDLIVEMDGPEPPIMDGSSICYAEAMQNAGIEDLGLPYPALNITKEITYTEGPISYKAVPSDKLTLTFVYTRDNHPLVSKQEYTVEMTKDGYLKEIAPARTFGYEEEIAFLKAHGLAKGGTVDNCIVIRKDGYCTELRYEEELVRHKLLDMVGDLKLIGKQLGPMHITCVGGGHKSNVEFAKILIKES